MHVSLEGEEEVGTQIVMLFWIHYCVYKLVPLSQLAHSSAMAAGELWSEIERQLGQRLVIGICI